MTSFDRDRFLSFVLRHKVIGFFREPLTLKSGRTSHFYVNWRSITNDAFLLDQLTDYVVAFIATWGIRCQSIFGVPEGASKTAVIAALKWAKASPNFALGSHRVAMGRAKPKTHGAPADRDFIGIPVGPTILLEDTVTTGGSLLQTLAMLRLNGVEVTGVLSLTDRQQQREDGLSIAEAIARDTGGQVPYVTMAGVLTLLPEAIRASGEPETVCNALIAEFAAYGTDPLVL